MPLKCKIHSICRFKAKQKHSYRLVTVHEAMSTYEAYTSHGLFLHYCHCSITSQWTDGVIYFLISCLIVQLISSCDTYVDLFRNKPLKFNQENNTAMSNVLIFRAVEWCIFAKEIRFHLARSFDLCLYAFDRHAHVTCRQTCRPSSATSRNS
jgi:hypothetical protein